MNSFLRCFLNWFMAAMGTVFFTASASTLFANDGLDKNVIKIKPPIIFSIDDSKRLIMLLDKVMAEDYMQMN